MPYTVPDKRKQRGLQFEHLNQVERHVVRGSLHEEVPPPWWTSQESKDRLSFAYWYGVGRRARKRADWQMLCDVVDDAGYPATWWFFLLWRRLLACWYWINLRTAGGRNFNNERYGTWDRLERLCERRGFDDEAEFD